MSQSAPVISTSAASTRRSRYSGNSTRQKLGIPCSLARVWRVAQLYTLTLPSKLHPTFPHPLHFSHVRYAPRHENGGRILHIRRIRHGDLNFHLFLVRISTQKADS